MPADPTPQARTILGVTHAPVGAWVPANACDCHVHVFGPHARYPLSPARVYTPPEASIEQLLALQSALRLERVVIVHPSPYGADNSCTVDALRVLGGRARGVAVIDEKTSDAALKDMHAAGVRGARVNLQTAGVNDPAAAQAALEWAARRVAPLGWHVQTYTNLDVLAPLHDAILKLPVPLVIDHFGRAMGAKGVSQPGFEAVLSLLKSGKAYVKISASYRISKDPDHADAEPIARAYIDANPTRVVWGTDWPHPGGERRAADEIEPFNPINDGRALNRLEQWTRSPAEIQKILVDNPARLYGF